MSIELGIPCYHTLYRKLLTTVPLTKWDIHPRWHLQEPVSRDVYRRILDPKIATNLRGRPKNKPQPIPTSMTVGASSQTAGRRVSSTQSRSSRPQRAGSPSNAIQTSTGQPSQGRTLSLRSGKTTGVRASGRRTQPSVRRRRCQWELSSAETTIPSAQTRLQNQRILFI
ncbi:transposase, partial [Metarhizium majus ARSEF 297]